ncbi:RICIN domain-containing protein [Saccharothrix sp. S26]|uniref:RICIN domain-containing protein n=1 Tax=Saccharothrix sp. S26 TaxID=2907215 RepID=UPI001F35D6A0|nr:ricin-type beta-trefoil lectin domain protein [Saccharothrix sp. S26]MCE7001085.1 RICIN domain-containing protein [Saccharothrix sp. S26]
MRALSAVLAAVSLITPTAHAAPEQAVIGSVGKPGTALTVVAKGEPVVVRPRTGGPEQEWRFHVGDSGEYLTLTNWQAEGCLIAYEPARVLLLECIGTQSQSWIDHPRRGGAHLLENAEYAGQCLTAPSTRQPVVLQPCAPGDRDQQWMW